MVEFILFVLLLVVGWYSVSTRSKLQILANAMDQVHAAINQAIIEDRYRLTKLEQRNHRKI